MFDASIQVKIGNGALAGFWTDKWLEGSSFQDLAPDLFSAVSRSGVKRTVREALQDRKWIRDITGPLSSTFYSIVPTLRKSGGRHSIGLGYSRVFNLQVWAWWTIGGQRVFNNKEMSVAQVVRLIKDEANLWHAAGANSLGCLMHENNAWYIMHFHGP
ncbi:hypothetical protein PR202_gb10790 [Eleusine coracana subsp. coracana]|uniref:Uncharacterized protein n=1 Tax=Eleusine coracana subsp. coracana TaxID=191504 RepID=A0AAV5EKE2_ELECO|nr:hypothetical protein PR202_gb10790 [Eleusine coracana subsp. coracana]